MFLKYDLGAVDCEFKGETDIGYTTIIGCQHSDITISFTSSFITGTTAELFLTTDGELSLLDESDFGPGVGLGAWGDSVGKAPLLNIDDGSSIQHPSRLASVPKKTSIRLI